MTASHLFLELFIWAFITLEIWKQRNTRSCSKAIRELKSTWKRGIYQGLTVGRLADCRPQGSVVGVPEVRRKVKGRQCILQPQLPCSSGRRKWQSTPVLLPGKSHGRRSLVASVHGVAMSRPWLSDFTHSLALCFRIGSWAFLAKKYQPRKEQLPPKPLH